VNTNHFSDPDQFFSPWLCHTTSGFLNFIGASSIRQANDRTALWSDPEKVMNQDLDEWFRWLYCAMETGVWFESQRVLVRRSNPEEFVYNYDGV
jgi:hypothetical protein